MSDLVLGIDIGGSGMKGAPVDVKKGEMETKRFRIKTPQPATPEAMVEVAEELSSTPMALFAQMTSLTPTEASGLDGALKNGGISLYAFRCNTCGRYRGHWDMD